MTEAIIGWEAETAVPAGHRFNDYLVEKNGRLHLHTPHSGHTLNLADLFLGDVGVGRSLPSPLEIIYLPLIRQRIEQMRRVFAEVSAEVGYNGRFHYTYASKANAAEEVIRTTLGAGANHEMSSTVDVDIARLMVQRGLLQPDKMVVCNGFKPAGSLYSNNILRLKDDHVNLIPVIEDLDEITPFLTSGKRFDVGLRQKSYGHNTTEAEMEEANSRFGLNLDGLWRAADYLSAAPNLTLKLYHYMVGSQLTDPDDFLARLKPGIEIYARLRKRHPHLSIFNFGGGMPVAMTLDFHFDYHQFVQLLLTTLQETCARYDVPEPDVMGEFGRYTTSEHGAHLFKIMAVKENGSKLPWYIIDGSIMSSFPDSWALGEHFICLPLTHLDKPFQQVQLGGITCDSDDVYPPKPSRSPLYLPIETDDLYIGFFSVGAYQEMLGGVKGSKHCVLPEAYELIVEEENGRFSFQILPGQTSANVLANLGYA
ncbi:MAG: hypothetical protein R3C62_10845 [Chloroflexota bacterium]